MTLAVVFLYYLQGRPASVMAGASRRLDGVVVEGRYYGSHFPRRLTTGLESIGLSIALIGLFIA